MVRDVNATSGIDEKQVTLRISTEMLLLKIEVTNEFREFGLDVSWFGFLITFCNQELLYAINACNNQ